MPQTITGTRQLRTRSGQVVRRKTPAKTKQLNKKINRIIMKNKEKKVHSKVQAPTGLSSSGILVHINDIIIGDTHSERDGNTIFPYKLRCRLSFSCADASNMVRVIIVKANLDRALTIADVIDTGSLVNPNQFYRREWYEEKLGTIVMDRVFNLTGVGSNFHVIHNRDYKLKGKTQYKGGAATDYGEGHYYMIAISDSGVVSHPTFAYELKLLYTDA